MRKGYLRYAAAILGHALPGTVASFAFGSSRLVLNLQLNEGVRPIPRRKLVPVSHRHKYSTKPINFAAYIETRGAL